MDRALIDAEFAELQTQMRQGWPHITLRSIGEVERVLVVVHSISFDVPDHLIPVFPAYEERFLCLVLSLLRAPRSRVIYVTSQPIHPRVLDYWFGLVPDLDTAEARERFRCVSLVDGSNRPLSQKLLERPGAVARIREMIGNPELALMLPFCTTPWEVELAVRLGTPLFGAHPDLGWLGTKQGSRQVFLEEDVPHPHGFEVADRVELAAAAARLPGERAIAKLNDSVSGLGNAQVDMTRLDRGLAGALELEDTEISVEEYLDCFDEEGGIVEELVQGTDFRSPSVQIRMSPAGQVDILSTHDQVLGGPNGQTYFGCHFPADQEYAARLATEGLKVGRRLAREGVLGRAAVDFVAVRDGGAWRLNAVEINLRCGGTTHPFFALQALTDGVYDPLAGEYRTRLGDVKHYAATDHLDSPGYRSLTPDDLLDVVADRGLGWDRERETGVALHMVSALAVAGRIGLTAIGDTLEEARAHYYAVKAALDETVGVLGSDPVGV